MRWLRRQRGLSRAHINPEYLLLKRLQHMPDDRFMDWVFADGYKGHSGGLRAYAAVRWTRIRWPDDHPDTHRAEAEAVFAAHDAAEKP
jgi:hypothetical protein